MGKLQFLINDTYNYESISRNTSFASLDNTTNPRHFQHCHNSIAAVTAATDDTDTMMSYGMNSPQSNTVVLYVVQKCWFSGPNVQPPMDCLRLFDQRQAAEQVAYTTAHLYAAQLPHSTPTSSKSATHLSQRNPPKVKPPVRTLQLPERGHGFVAAGQLFWVRQVHALATTPLPAPRYGEAHGILHQGIIGGGDSHGSNHPTRRQMSDDNVSPRIFCGPHSSHAALQVVASRRTPLDGIAGNVTGSSTTTVQWLPVGVPASVDQMTSEWPDAAVWLTNSNSNNSNTTVGPPMIPPLMDASTSSSSSSCSLSSGMLDDSERSVWTLSSQPQQNGSGMMSSTTTTSHATKRGSEVEPAWFGSSSPHDPNHWYNNRNASTNLQQPHFQQEQASAQFAQPPSAKRLCRPVSESHAAFLNSLSNRYVPATATIAEATSTTNMMED